MRAARAPLLACVVIALAIIAVSGQDAIAQLYAESAHYYASDGAVEVRLDVTTSWVDTQGIRLVGANNGSFVTGAVFHSGNVISITLDGARGDFEGLEHPRYVVVRAGGINGTDGVYNAEDLRVAISYDDTAPPEVSSAEYDAGTGILSVSFSETVWRVDMGSVRVYGADGAGIAVAAGRHGPGDDAAYVDLEPGATPAKLYISAGGVADIWGNANSAELSGAVSVIATVSPPINGTVSPPINGTVSPPINGTVSPPINGTVSPPINGTVSPPINGTVSPPINGTVSPPINGTVSPPINGTVSPPINGTVSPPINGTRDDTKPESPPIRSAVYYTDNGTISVQFSEAIQAVNGSRMEITDGDRAVSLDGVAEYGSAAVTTLELADRAALSGAASLNLTIQAGAVHDMHSNPIDAVRDVPVDIAWGAAELGFAAAASGGGEASFGAGDFVTTWKTTTASESITISVGGHAGTYTVDWGDGTTPTTKSGNATHTYASAGSYNVSISGDFERFQAGNQDNASKLIALVQWGNKTWDSMHSAFARANNMVYKATDTPNLADVTDMQYMFSDATSFNGDLSKWDVSKVTDMQYMFNGATSFNGDLSKWDVSKVTDMGYMFRGATSFNGDLSKWDVSKVTAMEYMFSNTASFNGDLSKWDVSKVTNMGYMFHDNTSFNGNISKWDVSKVINTAHMFTNSFFNGNISKWDVSKVINMWGMFENATSFNGNISKWDVSKVTAMGRMFKDATSFNGNISKWDVSKVTTMGRMFEGATAFSQNLGSWYMVLADHKIKHNLTVGSITPQNAYLSGHSPAYSLVDGAGDADNSLFEISGSALSIKQSPAKTTYSVRIGANADSLFGQNNAVPITLTYDGIIVNSATYATGNGTLIVSFSQPLNTTAHDASKIHIRDAGQSGGVALSNGIITDNGTSSITFDLNNADTSTVNAMATPQLDIGAGAVQNATGNTILAMSGLAVTINDTTRPAFSSASFSTGTGILTISFSEALNTTAHDTSKIHVRESGSNSGGVTFSNSLITVNGTSSITFDLNDTDTDKVNAMATPQLDIGAGAVSDTAGNQIAAIADQAITINDTIRPTFTSAAYATGSGELTITFSEPLDSAKHVATKLHIRESGSNMGGVTLSNGTITTNGTNSLTITLSNSNRTTVAGLTTPQLDIDAGAVSDTAGNQIASIADQAITINDTTKPTFSSAAYTTGSGQLAITFSEPLDSAKHVATKLHIRESGSNMGGVTLSNGTITTNGTNSLTITLSNSNRTTVAGLTTPQLDIDAGAVSDTAGNQIASIADQAITINDTTKPTFSSAAYTTGSGQLAITFSEPLDSAKHVATKLHIRESGSNMGGVTLSNGTITTNGTNSLTITLSNSNRTTVAGLTTPQLDIDAGAVSDRVGNAISAISDRTVTVQDTIPPTLIYATYATGILTISFSEALDTTAHDASKIHIRNTNQSSGGVTLSNAMITATATDSITFTLNAAHADRVNAMAAPELDIEQGAVRDVAGNFMSATHDNPVSTPAVSPPAILPPLLAFFIPESTPPLLVMNDDSIRPEMVSARVDVSEPTLLVTFDEHVTVSDWSGFALRSGPNVLALAEPFNNGTRLVSAKIDGNLSDAITLDVAEGTVVDASGNANPPYGNLTLGLAPVMKSASYDNSTRILKITFDQSVMPGNLSRILLNGHAIGMSKPLGTLNGDTLYLALAETSLNASDNTVRVQTGAVLDGRGAPFETNQTVPLHLPQSYTAPPQAVYSAVSGTMWLEMDGGNISLNGSAITVRNSTAQIRLSDAHVMLNGIARYSGNATLSPGGDAVLHMDIPAGAIRADSGTVPATGNLAVDVFGGINTTAISGFHAGNDTISVSLMQPGLAVVASLQGISVFDIMNASARAAFVPLNLTVLDMNPVPNTDHLAVLAPGAVLFLDLADPASPKWAGVLNFTDAASHGTVTPLIAEGVPYVVSVAEDTITQILASDPAKPKVVSSATISRGPPDGSGSTSPGFDKLYTSLLPETICVVDVAAPQYDARCMAHSGTPGSMDAAVSGGALHLVSATDAPGASIRAGTLEEVLSVRTGDAPADIGVVDAYGTAYVLVAADVLYAFDMSGDVIHKGVDGPYVSLDVSEFGGSTYAALLDTGDTIHVINLDGP